MYLKCIIVISNNAYLACKFLCNFILSNTKFNFSRKFWKNCDNSAPYQARLAKIITVSCCKYTECKILYDSKNPRQSYHDNFRKSRIATPLLSCMYPNCIIVLSNDAYFVYKFYCNFIHQKPKSTYPKNFLKAEITVPPVQ